MKRVFESRSNLFLLLCFIGVVLLPLMATGQSMPSTTFLPMATPAVLRMHAGGAASGIWSAETGLGNSSGASVVSTVATINPSLDPFPAPQSVYQTARTGTFTYTISSLTPGATYPVNLHFAEIQVAAAGQRVFNVAINGVQVLSNFDIFATAGGENMAIERVFSATASSTGAITIQFSNGTAGVALVNAIEVLPPVSSTLNTGVYTVVSEATGLNLDSDNVNASRSGVVQFTGGRANTNQQWQINELADGSYALLNVSNGLALDTQGLTSSGSALVETTSSPTAPTATQLWKITSTGNSAYTIASAASGLFMDSGATATAGAAIAQNSNSAATSQLWKIVPVQIGAATPFTTYEAEWGQIGNGATVISQLTPQPTKFVTPAIEASGRAYVHLVGTSAFVQWTNNTGHPVTAINLRYSIPDAPTGGGINATIDLYANGTFRQSLPVTSTQTWTYENNTNYFGTIESPAPGDSAYEFWDEVHAMIAGDPVQPGQTIMVSIDSNNTASFYDIDSIDLEAPPAPLTQPANSLSVASCGAVANDPSSDSTAAFQNCINQAQTANQSVWIPAGTYYLSSELTVNSVALQGAGMWYSVLYWNVQNSTYQGNNLITGASGTFENFAMDSSSNRELHKFGLNLHGDSWLINKMWLQHAGPSVWVRGTNGIVENSRINNSFADGINLNNGIGTADSNTGNNLSAINNFIRGTGDDGIAINNMASSTSNPNTVYVQMQSPTEIQNTVIAPWWANCLRADGGINLFVANNFTSGGSRDQGIAIGPFFPGGGKFESGKIQGNILFQPGGRNPNGVQYSINAGSGSSWSFDPTQVTNAIIRGNTSINATFGGVQLQSMQNGVLGNNTLNTPGLDGIDIGAQSQGNALFDNNSVLNLLPTQAAFKDNATTFSATGSGNNGFTPQ